MKLLFVITLAMYFGLSIVLIIANVTSTPKYAKYILKLIGVIGAVLSALCIFNL